MPGRALTLVLLAMMVFAAASVLGALTPSVWVLAMARALQGLAAAVSVHSALRLLPTLVPEVVARRRAAAGRSAAGAEPEHQVSSSSEDSVSWLPGGQCSG